MITTANLGVFFANLNTMLGETYSMTPVIHEQFSSTIPSSSNENIYAWIGRLDKFRLWSGPRVTKQPAPQTYVLVNQPFELTVMIDRFVLDDDQMGVYYRTLPEMAIQAKRWPDFQIRDLLQNLGAQTGVAQNGLDGLTFFNTAHPVDIYDTSKGTYCNDFTGGGVAINGVTVGGTFGVTSLATLYEYMTTIPGEDGEPVGVTPNTVLVPATLKLEAELTLKSMFMAPPAWGTISGQVGAADNPLKRFSLDVIDWPLLNTTAASTAGSVNWYMLDTTKAFRPIIWQVRQAPQLVQRITEQDPVVFDQHQYLYGYWARGVPGWGFSWLMARSGP